LQLRAPCLPIRKYIKLFEIGQTLFSNTPYLGGRIQRKTLTNSTICLGFSNSTGLSKYPLTLVSAKT
jgi:hypothetical protein